jgi:hypothetical protein
MLEVIDMANCPNCGRRAQRTKDWVCEFCGYPLLYGSYKVLDKTYKELQAERNPLYRGEETEEPEPDLNVQEEEEEVAPEPEPPPTPSWKNKKAPRPSYPTRPQPEQEEPGEYEAAPPPRPKFVPPIRPRTEAPAAPPLPPISQRPRLDPRTITEMGGRTEPPKSESPQLPRLETPPAAEPSPITPPPSLNIQRPAPRIEPPMPPLQAPRIYVEPPPPPPKEEAISVPGLNAIQNGVQLSVDQVDALFRADSIAANEAFKEKTIILKGIVNKVFIRDHLDIRYMVLTGARRVAWSARCQFDKEAAGPIGRLTEGQAIALKGKYDGYGKNIIFKECVLIAGS